MISPSSCCYFPPSSPCSAASKRRYAWKIVAKIKLDCTRLLKKWPPVVTSTFTHQLKELKCYCQGGFFPNCVCGGEWQRQPQCSPQSIDPNILILKTPTVSSASKASCTQVAIRHKRHQGHGLDGIAKGYSRESKPLALSLPPPPPPLLSHKGSPFSTSAQNK